MEEFRQLDSRPVPVEPDPLTTVLRKGYDQALPVLIARIVSKNLHSDQPGVVALSTVASGTWPLIINLILWALFPQWAYREFPNNLFALVGIPICITMLAAGLLSWRMAITVSPSVIELVPSSEDRAKLANWLDRRLGILPQVLAAAIGLISAVAALVVAIGYNSAEPSLILLLAWLGFCGGATLYWLLAAAEFPLRLLRCRYTKMTWIDPATTPGIRHLCALYSWVAGATALGLIASEVGTILVFRGRYSPAVQAFILAFPVVAAILALYAGVQPFVSLSRLVRRHLDRILEPLLVQPADLPAHWLTAAGLDDVTRTYQYFRSLRRLPVRTGVLVQYVAGIIASLIVFFVQQFLF